MIKIRNFFAVLTTVLAFLVLAPVTQAEASVQRCWTNYTHAYWTSDQGYTYPRHGWCMRGSGYELIFGSTGNFYVNRVYDGRIIWSANTDHALDGAGAATTLRFRTTAGFRLYDAANRTRWDNGTYREGHRATYSLWFDAPSKYARGKLILQINDYTTGKCTIEWSVSLLPAIP